jgi:hypothetical protein
MKVLFVVPHFYKAQGVNTRYASYSAPLREARREVLDRLIMNLHRLFGTGHYGAQHQAMKMVALPNPFAFTFDLKICTTGDSHLIDALSSPAHYYQHVASDAEPLLLGYFCHNVLKTYAGMYDYYCYLEDDILIHDPYFFKKLEFFNQRTPETHLLQPQRYDCAFFDGRAHSTFLTKVYPDYQTRTPAPGDPLLRYDMEFLGVPVRLEQTTHPHAGSFFLTEAQFQRLLSSPDFGHTQHVNRKMALDHAATLAIAKNFVVLKPDSTCMSFFEVEHGIINMLKQVSLDDEGNVQWYWDPAQFDVSPV